MSKFLSSVTTIMLLVSGVSLSQAQKSKRTQREETPAERFYRKGGKETKAKIISEKGELTTSDIAQERGLSLYDSGGHFNCRSWIPAQDDPKPNCDIPKVRDFIWQHWENKQRAYIRITFDSVDAVSTSHIFIEPDQNGKWHVAWRIVRHLGEITDIPDIRSIKQRRATREDFECNCKPGTMILSFIDWEGDEIQAL